MGGLEFVSSDNGISWWYDEYAEELTYQFEDFEG